MYAILSDLQIIGVTHNNDGEGHSWYTIDLESPSNPHFLSGSIHIGDNEEAIASVNIPTWNGKSLMELCIDATLDATPKTNAQ